MKKLAGVEAPLANFFASGVLALGHKLGPVLWQLPETFRYDAERVAAFFAQVPRRTPDGGLQPRKNRSRSRRAPDRQR
jgi:uncharacterized protein YecE (DUF72 family)